MVMNSARRCLRALFSAALSLCLRFAMAETNQVLLPTEKLAWRAKDGPIPTRTQSLRALKRLVRLCFSFRDQFCDSHLSYVRLTRVQYPPEQKLP